MGSLVAMGGGLACSPLDERSDLEDSDRAEQTTSFRVQAKSFIRWVDPSEPPPEGGSSLALSTLIGTMNLAFNEEPADGTQESGEYRMFLQFDVSASCLAGEMDPGVRVDAEPVTDFGTEAGLPAPRDNLQFGMSPFVNGQGELVGYDIHSKVSARPNPLTEPGFALVKSRDNKHIFQEMTVELRCAGSTVVADAVIGGSRFPTHKAWVTDQNTGVVETVERDQGQFRELWVLPDTPDLGVADLARVAIGGKMYEQLLQPGAPFVYERICGRFFPYADDRFSPCSPWEMRPNEGLGPLGSVGMFPVYPDGGDPYVVRSVTAQDGHTAWGETCPIDVVLELPRMDECIRDVTVPFADAIGGYDAFVLFQPDGTQRLTQSLFTKAGDVAFGRECGFHRDDTSVNWSSCASPFDSRQAWFEVPFSPPLSGYGTTMWYDVPAGEQWVRQSIVNKDGHSGWVRDCPVRDGSVQWNDCEAKQTANYHRILERSDNLGDNEI